MSLSHLKKIADSGITVNENDIFAFVDKGRVIISKKGAPLNFLSDNDLIAYDINSASKLSEEMAKILDIFKMYPDIRAVIITYPNYLATIAKNRQSLPPILDDMAQVVGLSLKYVDKTCRYTKHLKWRNCLLLSDGGLLALGRTVEEAITATLVAEKSAMCYLEAKKLSGAKRINCIRAFLMFMVYKKKYSRENIKRQRSGSYD